MPLNDADRLNRLRAAKLRALVATRWQVPADVEPVPFPSGASLRFDGVVWVLIEDDPVHRLGAVLAIALRAEATEAHVVVADGDTAAILARRAGLFRIPVSVWTHDGASLVAASPRHSAVDGRRGPRRGRPPD